MSSTTSAPEPIHNPEQARVIGGTIHVYRWGFLISLVLIVAGIIVTFARGETMPGSLGSPSHVFNEFLAGHGDGIVGLGILVMILTPLIGVITLGVNFFLAEDRKFGLITSAIVLILIGSVAFSYI